MATWTDDLFGDPLGWLAALGTGATVYDYYRNQRLREQANRLIRDITAYNAAAANIPDPTPLLWSQSMNMFLGSRLPLIAAASRVANQPLNIAGYMQQLTDMEKAAILRPPISVLQAQGVQPGGYWNSVVADALAKDARERFGAATSAAAADRGAQLQGLQALLGLAPPFIPPPPFNRPAGIPYPPSFSAVPTDRAPLLDYFRFLARRRAPTSPEDSYPEPRTYEG